MSQPPLNVEQLNALNRKSSSLESLDLSQLPEHSVVLRGASGSTVILIGTAHISEQSVADVRNTIRSIQPHQVLIELCPARLPIINPDKIAQIYANRESQQDDSSSDSSDESKPSEEQESSATNKDEPKTEPKQDSSFFSNLKGSLNRQGGILAFAISYMYQSISNQVKLDVGDDMRTAAEEAAKIGARIVLGDRPIGVTLARAWAGLSTWQKIKLGIDLIGVSFSSIKAEDIEMLKNKDILTELIKELSQQYPTLCTHLLFERDLFLAARLRNCPGPIVVGVVGMGHVAGIKANWTNPIDINSLMITPPKSSWKAWFAKVIGIFSLIIGFIAVLVYWLKY